MTVTVSDSIKWRTTGGDVITRKFSYINSSATDEQLSNFAKALSNLSSMTYITSEKTATYDIEVAREEEEEDG